MHLAAIALSLFFLKSIAETAAGRQIAWGELFAVAAVNIGFLALLVAGVAMQVGFAFFAGIAAASPHKPGAGRTVPQIVVGGVALVFSIVVFGGIAGLIGGALSIAGGAWAKYEGDPSAPLETPSRALGPPVRWRRVVQARSRITLVAGIIVGLFLAGGLLAGILFPPATAGQMNLSGADMPGWTMESDTLTDSEDPGIVDSSARVFSRGPVFLGSQVIRFDTRAHAQEHFDAIGDQLRALQFPLEEPSAPPVGDVSLYWLSNDVLLFRKSTVVVQMHFSPPDSGTFAKMDLMAFATVVASRIS